MATCKDCLHNHVCALWRAQEGQDAKSWSDSDDWDCDYFADKSRFVELPCKVGDTVYEIQNNTDACHDCEHYSDFYGMDAMCDKKEYEYKWNPWVSDTPVCDKHFYEIKEFKPDINWIFNYRSKFGKTVFLTREEAEAALAERMKDGSK